MIGWTVLCFLGAFAVLIGYLIYDSTHCPRCGARTDEMYTTDYEESARCCQSCNWDSQKDEEHNFWEG